MVSRIEGRTLLLLWSNLGEPLTGIKLGRALACVFCLAFAAHSWGQAVQQPPPPKEADQRSVAPDKPETLPGGAPVDPSTYKIGPEDVLEIRIWREPELSRPYVVRPDGKIGLFMVKEIDAAGLTPTELETNVTKAYSAILRNPIVSIQVLRVESKKYYISGEVYRTGAFPLVSPTTILQAVTMAGGVREFGNGKKS